MNELKISKNVFENIKHIDELGNEYWSARELQKALDYSKWERFSNTIDNAKIACQNSGYDVNEHFPGVGKLSKRNNGAIVKIKDYKLSRYACYLIAQNGDSRKKVIALAQTYFADKTKNQDKVFDDIKHIDDNGHEYWDARELMTLLGYKEWRYFSIVIEKAKTSYLIANNDKIDFDFGVYTKIVKAGATTKTIINYRLSRYACYLIAQNANPKYKNVALAQTYFAVQTRKQELIEEEYKLLSEDEKRLKIRNLTKKGDFNLNQTAKKAGVKNFDKFHNYGYKGLYNGETANDIAKRKGLRYREDILDNMGSSELATNLFRIEQTNEKLIKDNIEGENNANMTHYNMGKDIRKFIKKQGGTMPEDLPTPKKSLKEIEKLK